MGLERLQLFWILLGIVIVVGERVGVRMVVYEIQTLVFRVDRIGAGVGIHGSGVGASTLGRRWTVLTLLSAQQIAG